MRIGIVTFPGSLDDVDAARAVRVAGGEPVPIIAQADDVQAQAVANRLIARAASRLGDHETAEHRLQLALKLYGQLGDLAWMAQTLHNYT